MDQGDDRRRERRDRRKSDFLRVRDGDDRVVDFHALRATYITMLVKSGASVKETQELARHSDPKLTMNVHTRLGVHDLAGALERRKPMHRSMTAARCPSRARPLATTWN